MPFGCRRGQRVGTEDAPTRTVHLNDSAANNEYGYPNNFITTSKYTWYNFIPKNLYEQFHRIANCYFLLIACLQQIPGISPLGRGTTAMTLTVVLTFTALKELLEDWRRHKNDKEVNSRLVYVVREGEVGQVAWKDVRVGDICWIENGGFFPADMFLISTSEPQGMCYVETSNLDGESNLKIRQALPQTADHTSSTLIQRHIRGHLACDLPNAQMYSFNGRLFLLEDDDEDPDHVTPLAIGGDTPAPETASPHGRRSSIAGVHPDQLGVPAPSKPRYRVADDASTLSANGILATNKQVLLRGAQLRNTKWAFGLVIYTGRDTKLTKSSHKVTAKRSNVERNTNKLIILIFIAQLLLCLTCAVGNGLWLSSNKDSAVYLGAQDMDPATNGTISFLTFLILFSNLIPISLYVSMETVKFAQSYLINCDVNMYYAEKNIPATCRTSNLNEELGQVQYIFSDKTGTLTCNSMDFKMCSIAGVVYGDNDPAPEPPPTMGSSRGYLSPPVTINILEATQESSLDGRTPRSNTSTVSRLPFVAAEQEEESSASASSDSSGKGKRKEKEKKKKKRRKEKEKRQEKKKKKKKEQRKEKKEKESDGEADACASTDLSTSAVSSNSGSLSESGSPPLFSYDYTYSETYEEDDVPSDTFAGRSYNLTNVPFLRGHEVPHCCFVDSKDKEFEGAFMRGLSSTGGVTSQMVHRFVENLAVCHTVIPEVSAVDDTTILYQAASPDEGALVNAARYFGYYFHTRTPSHITLNVLGRDQEYEILRVNEFSSSRKRMSVVVRMPDGSIRVMVKGADMMMMDLLDEESEHNKAILDDTNTHLDAFAREALRTLVIADRTITEEEYMDFMVKYDEAAKLTARQGKRQAMAQVAEMVENNLTLLGATAIEDKLQDGVPETIAALRKAGIRVWVLTGDKQETAIMIGYSCKLIDSSMRVVIPSAQDPTRAAAAGHFFDDEEDTAVDEATPQQKKQWLLSDIERHIAELDSALEVRENACVVDGRTLLLLLGEPQGKKKVASQSTADLQRNAQGLTPEEQLDERLRTALLDLTARCKSVIGCRVSPAQKAQIVAFVQSSLEGRIVTLAIGDGANDVDMIKEAHIGIGISGAEGQQASLASDYSIAQFRYLSELLLVHGHWCYHRIAKLIFYSFYKNIALSLVPFWFVFFSGYSGQTIVEKWTFALYNVVFTALPPLVIGVYDQCLPRASLLEIPELYQSGQRNRFFTVRMFVGWMTSSLYHSIICYFFVQAGICHNVLHEHGQTMGLFANGFLIMAVVVLTVNGKAALETNNWTIFNVLAIFLSIFGYFFWVTVYSYIVPPTDALDALGVGPAIMSSPLFWLGLLLATVTALLPDFLWKYVKRTYFPEPYDIVKELCLIPGLYRTAIKPVELLAQVASMFSLRYPARTDYHTGYAYDAAPQGHHEIISHAANPAVGLLAVRTPPISPHVIRRMSIASGSGA